MGTQQSCTSAQLLCRLLPHLRCGIHSRQIQAQRDPAGGPACQPQTACDVCQGGALLRVLPAEQRDPSCTDASGASQRPPEAEGQLVGGPASGYEPRDSEGGSLPAHRSSQQGTMLMRPAAIDAATHGAGRCPMGLHHCNPLCGTGPRAQCGLSAGCRHTAQDTEAADLLLGTSICSRQAASAYWIPAGSTVQLHRRRLCPAHLRMLLMSCLTGRDRETPSGKLQSLLLMRAYVSRQVGVSNGGRPTSRVYKRTPSDLQAHDENMETVNC